MTGGPRAAVPWNWVRIQRRSTYMAATTMTWASTSLLTAAATAICMGSSAAKASAPPLISVLLGKTVATPA
ncbi:MAG: hypothetical protein R2854_15215 [Caldilineaceae bacterium]